jgi:hypothetical protein
MEPSDNTSLMLTQNHLPGTKKICDPAQLFKYGSWKKVEVELAKCELACANCHRIRTHKIRAKIVPNEVPISP